MEGIELTGMLTVSTLHVRPETTVMLDREPDDNELCLSVYFKDSGPERYGYFIYVPQEPEKISPDMPIDLARLLALAKEKNCGVLCLDADGPEIHSLPTYETEWANW